MMPTITNKFVRITRLSSAVIVLLFATGCVFTSTKFCGSYSAVTDFSRDLYSMRGRKETILYKNGRKETITFTPEYRFIKKVTFTSQRVEDKTSLGHWKKLRSKIIEVTFSGKKPVEYYKQVSKNTIIRLDGHQMQLSKRYAPYFTFEKNNQKPISKK